jgi:CRP-like cAMP-binding protein
MVSPLLLIHTDVVCKPKDDIVKHFLSEIYQVNDEILDKYISEWTEYTAPKRTIMTAPGETERYMYFVLEGVQKSYYLNNDKQHIIAFTYPPSFSGIPESFLTQTPSKYFLEAITYSRFLRLSFEKHQKLMHQHREIETLFRKATELFLAGMVQRHYELMAFNIETRIQNLYKKKSPFTQHDFAKRPCFLS